MAELVVAGFAPLLVNDFFEAAAAGGIQAGLPGVLPQAYRAGQAAVAREPGRAGWPGYGDFLGNFSGNIPRAVSAGMHGSVFRTAGRGEDACFHGEKAVLVFRHDDSRAFSIDKRNRSHPALHAFRREAVGAFHALEYAPLFALLYAPGAGESAIFVYKGTNRAHRALVQRNGLRAFLHA